MNTTPKVSIIIPTFNRADLLRETLQSILEQDFRDWECILVDDGSSDHTFDAASDFIASDSRFSFHHRPKNRPKGANACRNYGLEISKGEFVNWFDSDDLIHRDKLKLQYAALSGTDYNFSVCQCVVFKGDVSNILGVRHEKITSADTFADFVSSEIVWLTPSALWKREFLMSNELRFDETLHAAQEWEFHARVLLDFPQYHVEPAALVFVRQHENSVSYDAAAIERRNRNYFIAREKIFRLISKKGISPRMRCFFRKYFFDAYKFRLRTGKYGEAWMIYSKYLASDGHLKTKDRLKMLAAIFTYRLFKKGQSLLNIDIS